MIPDVFMAKAVKVKPAAFAWGLAAFTLVATCGDIALGLLDPRGLPLNDPDRSAWIDYLQLLFFPVVGALIARKHPTNPVGWLLLAYSVASGLAGLNASYAQYGVLTDPGSLPGAGGAAWVATWSWMLALPLIPLILLHFPSGWLPSPRWRWARWLCGAPIVLLPVPAVAWVDKPANQYWRITEGALLGEEGVAPFLIGVFATAISSVLVSLVSLVVRYRRGGRQERQQLKWIMLAAAVLVVQGIWETFLPGPEALKAAAGALAFAGVPAAIGIAILRYRLYDIDRIINRTLVYGALSAMIGGVYALTALAGAALGSRIELLQSDVVVAGVTLAVAAAFQPLRRRTQSFVDRRFYRSSYDALQTAERFGVRLRDEVDLDSLTQELLSTINRTLQPEHASLWRRR